MARKALSSPKQNSGPSSADPPSAAVPQPQATPATGEIRIGISGWRYKGWRGVFYPPELQQRRELEFASHAFNTIEINGTFYSLQHHTSFRQWASETPDNFIFSIKGSRFITHMKKLRNIDQAFANLLASGLLALGPKLGPILWQFPPQMRFDPVRFSDFFRLLPRTTAQAAQLAQGCDERMLPRSVLEASVNLPLRHVVEIRHESFATPAFISLLREHDIGLVVADTPDWPLLLDATSSLVYLRLHGSEQLYSSSYTDDALDIWADRIVTWARGISPTLAPAHPRDIFVYFDNDAKVHAPFDAQNLRTRVDTLLGET